MDQTVDFHRYVIDHPDEFETDEPESRPPEALLPGDVVGLGVPAYVVIDPPYRVAMMEPQFGGAAVWRVMVQYLTDGSVGFRTWSPNVDNFPVVVPVLGRVPRVEVPAGPPSEE